MNLFVRVFIGGVDYEELNNHTRQEWDHVFLGRWGGCYESITFDEERKLHSKTNMTKPWYWTECEEDHLLLLCITAYACMNFVCPLNKQQCRLWLVVRADVLFFDDLHQLLGTALSSWLRTFHRALLRFCSPSFLLKNVFRVFLDNFFTYGQTSSNRICFESC